MLIQKTYTKRHIQKDMYKKIYSKRHIQKD